MVKNSNQDLSESRWIRAGDADLEYAWIGKPPSAQRPTLVFLHEGLGSLGLWKDFPDAVCAQSGLSGLVYSRAGHGGSEPFAGPRSLRFMHDEALIVLPELLDKLKVVRPILFGHSDGGSIALIYAGASKATVTGLVLEAPHVFVEDLTISSIETTKRRFQEGNLRERLRRHHRHSDVLFNAWIDVWLSPAFRAWNIEDYVRLVQAPTLLLQGTDDEYGTTRQLDVIAANVKGRCRKILLKKCGHAPHIDRRAAVERLTKRFLQRLSKAPGQMRPQSATEVAPAQR